MKNKIIMLRDVRFEILVRGDEFVGLGRGYLAWQREVDPLFWAPC